MSILRYLVMSTCMPNDESLFFNIEDVDHDGTLLSIYKKDVNMLQVNKGIGFEIGDKELKQIAEQILHFINSKERESSWWTAWVSINWVGETGESINLKRLLT